MIVIAFSDLMFSWGAIWMDCSLCDKVFLTVDFDSYMSKEHENHWAQIRKAIYSSIFNLFKMAAKTGKSEFKNFIKL